MAKIKYKDWNTSQDNRIHLSDGIAPALGSSSGSSKPIIQVIQKTGGYCTTFKINETGTLQSGGANVMDKVPNIVVKQINDSKESGGKQPYQQNRIYDAEGLSPTLDQAAGKWQVKTILDTRNKSADKKAGKDGNRISEDCPTLNSSMAKDMFKVVDNQELVGNIRRLTEIECERLQGYKDNHTAFGMYPKVKVSQEVFNKLSNEDKIKLFNTQLVKKAIPKTQRYKLCGNAVTTDVVELIGIKMLAND